MSRIIASIGIGLAVILTCCKSNPSRAKSPMMTRDEVESKLVKVVGLQIPSSAINVIGSEVTAFTYIFDCAFECSLSDLKDSWRQAPKLVVKVPVDALTSGDMAQSRIFDGGWPVQGGMQFANIELSKLDRGNVRVKVRTTHEMK